MAESLDAQLAGETVELEDAPAEVVEHEDGSATIVLDERDNARQQEHFANIVEAVDARRLKTAVDDLLEKIERDKQARSKRDKLYEEGLRRTGLGDDAPGGASFTGANRVVHPLLVEACVDFSARVMKEIMPPGGPVKSKIVGRQDKAKVEKAQRKAEFMNWQVTEQMPEFRSELEQLSTQLPLGGVQYLKLRWDAQRKRAASEFVAIDDIHLPFAATNFYSAERRTHVQYLTQSAYQAKCKAGDYVDVDLPAPESPEFSAASRANDKIEGREETHYNEDGLRTVFEVYTHMDIEREGDFWPYILTIDKSSGRGLALYRNWEEDDAQHTELEWIVEFPFVPWRGAYPIGLTHLIGGLSGGATGALRALLDSAHIQNIPTALKLKGGPSGQTLNVRPTEIAEIEGSGVQDDIRKIVMPLPFNGPSPTLFQLLGFLVDAGKGVVQTTFEKMGDQRADQPVGTTLALIEQGMVVFSSIHSRIHASMARVLKVLHRIDSAYLTQEEIDAASDTMGVKPEDFDGPMDVVPVSDPAIFSETQRFAQTQSVMQRAAMMPQLYDARRVEEMFLRAMKVPDDILQPKPGEDDMDPVSENVAAAMGRPIYVLPKQDHMAHLKLHMAFLESSVFGSNPAIVKTYLFPMAAHLRDHLLTYYLTEAHTAVQRVDSGDSGEEARIVANVQRMIEEQLEGFSQKLAKIDEAAQQFRPQPPMPPDSSLQVAQMTLAQRAQSDAQKLQLSQQKLGMDRQLASQRAELDKMRLALEEKAQQLRVMEVQFAEQSEDRRKAAELASLEGRNFQDNETALRLAAAELATGERFAVSTGTGINP